jgi:regulator of replication initiation timing
MKNLEDAQREMRERNARKRREEDFVQPEIAAADDSPEVVRLKREISALKEQVTALQMENNRLREQKTIVVERSRGQDKDKSYSDSANEQQRNFFKYSNVRRY